MTIKIKCRSTKNLDIGQIAPGEADAVHGRAEALSRTHCTRERLGFASESYAHFFVFFSLHGAGA